MPRPAFPDLDTQLARRFASNPADPEYAERQARFGLADKADVSAAFAAGGAVWLDVRSDGEVAGSSIPVPFTHIPVTMQDTSAIAARADSLPSEKATTILCFCGVGGRVMGAKKALEELGYTRVLNAGGYKDIKYLFE